MTTTIFTDHQPIVTGQIHLRSSDHHFNSRVYRGAGVGRRVERDRAKLLKANQNLLSAIDNYRENKDHDMVIIAAKMLIMHLVMLLYLVKKMSSI